MKKELMASVLTFTAGMASTVAFPQYALAKSVIVEKAFATTFRLKSENKVRYTDVQGQVITGHIYLNLEQGPYTPEHSNRLHGEMTGSLYFESDDYTSGYEGRQFKTTVPVTGEDGNVLLDLTHSEKSSSRTYQVYGCNSTTTQCSADSYEVTFFDGNEAAMDVSFPTDLKLEVEVSYRNQPSYWVTRTLGVKMVEVPLEQ